MTTLLATPALSATEPFDLEAAIKRNHAASRMKYADAQALLPSITSEEVKVLRKQREDALQGSRRLIVVTESIINRAKRLTRDNGYYAFLSALQCAFDEQYWLIAGYEEPYYTTSADQWGGKACVRLKRQYKETDISWELWHVVLNPQQRAMLHGAAELTPSSFNFFWWNNESDPTHWAKAHGSGVVIRASEIDALVQDVFGFSYDLREHVPINEETGLRQWCWKLGQNHLSYRETYAAIIEWVKAGAQGAPPVTAYELLIMLKWMNYAPDCNHGFIVID